MSKSYQHFINGQVVQGTSRRSSEILNPSTGEVSGSVTLATTGELDDAVSAARAALPEWSAMNPQRRARVLFNFKALVEANANSCTKTSVDELQRELDDLCIESASDESSDVRAEFGSLLEYEDLSTEGPVDM